MEQLVTRPILAMRGLMDSQSPVTVKEDPTAPLLLLHRLLGLPPLPSPPHLELLPHRLFAQLRLSSRNHQLKQSLRLLPKSPSLLLAPDRPRSAPRQRLSLLLRKSRLSLAPGRSGITSLNSIRFSVVPRIRLFHLHPPLPLLLPPRLSSTTLRACELTVRLSNPFPFLSAVRTDLVLARFADKCLDDAQPKQGGPADFSVCENKFNGCKSYQRRFRRSVHRGQH